ncbi:MAG TPA: preprotein translocase subunit SecA [Alphaproteobacteria bacterium]
MISSLSRLIFGSRNERQLKQLREIVEQINALEPAISVLDDNALTAKTAEFKARLQAGETLDQILPEAYAVVRETAKRVFNERHYDVQLMGGIVLHQGKIAEMRTGEGKTLVSTLPAYLNALTGKGVHVITVNDYLAKRDSDWMGRLHRQLGLTIGCIQNDMSDAERRAAYRCDITYGTNNEFGFDYLRDNLKFREDELSQRPFNYAIIDEVDSVLIDEARTPLIISGPAEDTSEMYVTIDALMPQITEDDIEKDEKMKTVNFTEDGVEKMEDLLRAAELISADSHLYDLVNMQVLHHVNMALRAHKMMRRDKDYIVKDGKIFIIDEFTGRMMAGRRFSEGQHQAIEAKERVQIQPENQTVASITLQNFFRLYPKMSGMTGTAMTEATEFGEIYNLDVVEMPTHRNVARRDQNDEIYRTEAEKDEAIIALVKECVERQQPALVGTTSIEKSEELSRAFKKAGIKHQVLNARHHEQEAFIVAQAGRPGAITIATNMAGRGTDIKLGGNAEMLAQQQLTGDETPEQVAVLREAMNQQVASDNEKVKEAGGLYVIGTERHESRRIDNQLRGRSGRQGDPGASKFFLSLQDDLMRIFGSERLDVMLQRLGLKPGESIFHPWINTAIEKAQKKVEAQHFDARRHLLKQDNVMNDQRKVIYELRRELMTADDVRDVIEEMIDETATELVGNAIPNGSYKEQWDVAGLARSLKSLTGRDLPVAAWADEEGADEQKLEATVRSTLIEQWHDIQATTVAAMLTHPDMFGLNAQPDTVEVSQLSLQAFNDLERGVVLHGLDKAWKDHLYHLDHVRQGINLRAYGQRDPLNEYRTEAFHLFQLMLAQYREFVLTSLFHLSVGSIDDVEAWKRRQNNLQRQRLQEIRPSLDEADPMASAGIVGFPERMAVPKVERVARKAFDQNDPATWVNTPRNSLCPCGSGKKYKHCHGKMAMGA